MTLLCCSYVAYLLFTNARRSPDTYTTGNIRLFSAYQSMVYPSHYKTGATHPSEALFGSNAATTIVVVIGFVQCTCASCIPCSSSTHTGHVPILVFAISSKSDCVSALARHHTSEIMALSRRGTALLVCDIQGRFKSAIYKFGAMSATSARMIRFAKVVL